MVKRLFSNSGGFTFIELVIVIVIIGVLGAVASSSLDTALDTSRHQEAQEELNSLAHAIAGNPELISGGMRSDFGYVGDVGALPANLGNLVTNPGAYTTWNGPYIRDNFNENVNDYSTDPWGTGYVYSGGVTIQSTGSGSTITKQIANTAANLTSNTIRGTILDRDGAPPGDSSIRVSVVITYPNGSGSITTSTVSPNSSGAFVFSGIPVGAHSLEAIYSSANDTAATFVAVAPRVGGFANLLRFGSGYWTDTTTGGGGGGGGTSEILRPDGDGASDDLDDEGCGDNWECVDEVAADGNGTYVKGDGSSYETDTYALQNSSVGSGTIDSVVVYINCWGSSSSMKAKTVLRTNGSDYFGSIVNLTSSYAVYSTAYATNPSTSSSWTWSEIDALEAGVSIRKEGRCTQVWVEVFYQ